MLSASMIQKNVVMYVWCVVLCLSLIYGSSSWWILPVTNRHRGQSPQLNSLSWSGVIWVYHDVKNR